MQRVKRRTFSGVVCEQEVYNVPDRIKSLEKAEPRPRFKNEEERELHRIGISRRKHARLINENYGPIEKRRAIKKALAAAGTTWPSYTNASDKEGQHHVFECQLARGVGAE